MSFDSAQGKRPPKRPGSGLEVGASLEEVLAAIRSRPSFGAGLELEAMETGGYTVLITRFKKPVTEMFTQLVSLPIATAGLEKYRVTNEDGVHEFFVNGCQAYVAAPVGSIRRLLAHPHDFLPRTMRSGPAYAAVALRVHLAGGSDQWVGRSKLEKFLASGRDGSLTGVDWGRLPE